MVPVLQECEIYALNNKTSHTGKCASTHLLSCALCTGRLIEATFSVVTRATSLSSTQYAFFSLIGG